MAGPQKPRVPTMRIVRPYDTEDDLIEGDFASLGRPWIILPDVPVLSIGELVRFEVLLSSGAPAIRGEGNVVAYHAPGGPKPAGLEVKFTRIDARTKSIIERVHAKRVALGRAASRPPEPPAAPPPEPAAEAAAPPEPVVEAAAPKPAAPPEPVVEAAPLEPAAPEPAPPPEPEAAAPAFAPPPEPAAPSFAPPPTPPPAAASDAHDAPAAPRDGGPTAAAPRRTVAAPPNRDEILERLRARARDLPPDKRFTRSPGA